MAPVPARRASALAGIRAGPGLRDRGRRSATGGSRTRNAAAGTTEPAPRDWRQTRVAFCSRILYDEIDTVFGPKVKDNEDIRGMLNAGHRHGATAGRCVVRGKIVETEELPAYCAVALAGLHDLPDTILTHSVVIRMRRRAPGERIEPFRHRVHRAEGHLLRDQLAEWAGEVGAGLEDAWPDMPPGIEDRAADVREALLAVADVADRSLDVAAERLVNPRSRLRWLRLLRTCSLREMADAPWVAPRGDRWTLAASRVGSSPTRTSPKSSGSATRRRAATPARTSLTPGALHPGTGLPTRS